MLPNLPEDTPTWLAVAAVIFVVFGGVIWRAVKRITGKS